MSDVDELLANAQAPEAPAGGETDVSKLLSGNSDAAKLSFAMTQGAKIAPDKAARVLQLASQTGLPHDLIERNPDEIEQAAKYAKFDAATFHHTSPITASWLSENPNQASIGGQDLPKLSFLERTLKAIGDPGDVADQFYRGRLSMQLYKIGQKAILGTATPEDRDLQERIEKRLQAPTDFGTRSFIGQIPGAIANQLPFFGQSLIGKAKFAAVGAGAGALAEGAGGAAIGSLAGPEGAAVMGAEGALQGGGEGLLLGWKYGAAVQDANIFGSLAYLDFEKMKDDEGNPLDRTTALGAATTVGVINGALGMIPFESMLKNVPVLRSLSQAGVKELLETPTARQAFLTYAKHVGQAAALGGGVGFTQAMVQSAASEIAKMKTDGSIFRLSPGAVLSRIFSDQNIEAATANAKMGLQAAGGTSAGLGLLSVHADLQRAKVGEAQAAAIKSVGDVAGGSEMMKTAPAQLRGLIARLTAGGRAENLYAPVDTWNQYFQGKNVDPREVAREVIGDTKSYDEAVRNGTDIQIPTERYATTLGAIPEHNEFFANELRADPTQMNGRESADFMKTLEKTAGAGELTPDQQKSEAVVSHVQQQLEAAGFKPEIAGEYAKVYRAFGAMGGRAGLDPMDFFKKYGLMISREIPGLLKEKGIDALDPIIDQLRAGETPAEGEGQGRELLDLLREKGIIPENEGSDLKGMDPDAELKPSQRKLLRPEGLTMDAAAELAQQHGYTAERSIPELIEKIRSSLAGEPQYAAEDRNEGVLAKKADLEEFSRYLDSLGIDPQKMDNAEIKRRLGEEEAKAGSARTALEQARQTAGPGGSPEEPGKPESWRASTSLPRDLSSWDSSITGMVKNVKALFGEEPLGRDTETPEMLRQELLKLKASGLTEDQAITARLTQLEQTTAAAVGIVDRALKSDDATRRTMLDRLNREIERRYILNDEQPSKAVREAHDKLRISLGGKSFEQPARVKTETPEFKRWFGESKVVDQNGQPAIVYHGTQRPDRIGERFRKSRATSGPMAFFTDSPELGSSYATKKSDTSIESHDYEGWYKFRPKGSRSDVNIDRAWWHLSPEQREKIAKLAPRVGNDDDGNLVLHPEGETRGLGGYDQHIKEARGNHLKALVEEWLNSGALYNQEEEFGQVLEMAGMKGAKYDSPYAEKSAVLPVYLSIKNPLDTSNIPEDVIAALQKRANKQKAIPADQQGSDLWDKTRRDPQEWMASLKEDMAKGKNSFVWSSIPDWVTDTLAKIGFDGIKDIGGKGGGEEHHVWIPFEENQVKSAIGNRGTFDPESNNILKQPAWHGSPHIFDQFKLNAIGSGEGHQAYGWGLYFAGSKDVAAYYRKVLTSNTIIPKETLQEYFKPGRIIKGYGGYDKVEAFHPSDDVFGWTVDVREVKKVNGEWKDSGPMRNHSTMPEGPEVEKALGKKLGRLYKVDIPEDSKYLDWDKKLSEQPAKVREALENVREKWAGWESDPDADTLYKDLSANLAGEPITDQNRNTVMTGEEKASRFLSQLGIAGIKYADSLSRGKDGGSSNYVVFDDKLVKIMEHEQAAPGEEPRGRMSFGSNRQFNIELLKGADLSTFLHETGHFYLEVLGDLAQGDKATPEIQADYQTILKWLGAGKREEIKTEQHEKFARGFEAYLMEGKAPSSELRSTFARFRAWLVGVYKQVKSLNVDLTPEVRQVFDRMLASDDEIQAAQREQHVEPLFADPRAVGMNEGQAQDYRRAIDEAQSAAEEQLAGKVMAEFNRERKSWWKDRSAEARKSIEEDVNGRKEYIARAVLQTGKMPDGSELPEGIKEFKLDKKALVDAYGKEFLKRLPRSTYATEDGVSPQAAAEAFGFRSGEELVMALANTQNRKQLIDSMTDQQMRETYGDMLTDGSVQVEAMKAVHNEKRGQLLQKELEYLATNKLPFVKEMVRRITRRIAPIEAVRDQASDTIAAKAARDIIPSLYQKAESRAHREAVEAFLKGDFEGTFEAKQRELLNHELYRAASNAKDDIDLIVGYMSKFDKSTIREKLAKAGGDYLAQIDAIRERFDFRKGVSLKDIDQRKSLVQWVEEQRAKGYDVTVPQKLLNEAYTQHYKDTSYDELTGIRDAVKTIEHLANTKNVLLALAQQRELGEARDQIIGSIKAYHDTDNPIIDFAPGLKDRMYQKAAGIAATHTRMEFLFEHLDGNNPHGPVWEALFHPFNESQNREDDMMRETTTRLNDIFGEYKRSERARWFLDKVHIPEIDDGTMTGYLNKANILAVALNWGNLYNREALMRGYGWKEGQVEAILKHMDARDWRTVQALWDHIDSYWVDAKKLEEDINGTAPGKVEAFPFDVHFDARTGKAETLNMRGGYYPIVFDNKLSWRQGQLDERSSVKEMFGGNWARAMTRHGHLEERENTGGKPLRLELSGLTNHISNVIHDISFRREVIDAHRIINDPEIRQTISNAVGREMYAQLNPWLHSIAGDRRGEFMNPIEGILGRARSGATVVSLGLNVVTGIVHALGYSLAAKELGMDYAGRGLADAWSQPWKLKENWDFVTSRSDMMRQRFDTGSYDRDVRDSMKRLNVAGVEPGIAGAVDAYTMNMHRSFMGLIGYMDLAVSLPIWLGAYRKAMDGGLENVTKGDEKAASEYGDQVVRQTKSAGAAKDLAMIQHGSQSWKLFTMFYSQMSLQFNQFEKTYNQFKLDRNAPKLLGSMALAWFVPAALDEIIRGRTPSVDDDDKEAWGKWLLRKELLYPFHSVILLRDIAHALDKYVDTGKPDFQGSPVFDVFNTAAKGASIPFKAAAGKDIEREDYKDAFNTVGYGFGLPTRQTWKTGEYVYDWMTGEEQPSNPVEGVWRAAVKGKSKK